MPEAMIGDTFHFGNHGVLVEGIGPPPGVTLKRHQDLVGRDLDAHAEAFGVSRMRFFGAVETDENFRARLGRMERTVRQGAPGHHDLLDIFGLAEWVKHVGVIATRCSDVGKAIYTESRDRRRRGLPGIHNLASAYTNIRGLRLDAVIDMRLSSAELPERVKACMTEGCEVVAWRDGWVTTAKVLDGGLYGPTELQVAHDATLVSPPHTATMSRERFAALKGELERALKAERNREAPLVMLASEAVMKDEAKRPPVHVLGTPDPCKFHPPWWLSAEARDTLSAFDASESYSDLRVQVRGALGLSDATFVEVVEAARDLVFSRAMPLPAPVMVLGIGHKCQVLFNTDSERNGVYGFQPEDLRAAVLRIREQRGERWDSCVERMRASFKDLWPADMVEAYSGPTEGERMAAFFATSEHKRHEDKTEPDWAQLDRFLPDECAMPNAETNGFAPQSVQYKRFKGVVEIRTAVHLDSGAKYTRWMSLSELARGPFPSPWHLERYHDAVHAQKLINEAIPGLPRVMKVGVSEQRDGGIVWRDETWSPEPYKVHKG